MNATPEQLVEAIRAIWKAPIYAERKRESGISLELIQAIREAAELAGIKGPDFELTPEMNEMADLLGQLEIRGIYPQTEGRSLAEILAELRALAGISRKEAK